MSLMREEVMDYPMLETESWRRCRWESKEAQYTRFQVLCSIGNLDYKSVLDVGCGDGELLRVLRTYYPYTAYKGIDCNLDMVEAAEARQGDTPSPFGLCDLHNFETRGFDYILFSGVFNAETGHNESEVEFAVDHYRNLCDIGVGINLLDDRYPYRHNEFHMFNVENMFNRVYNLGVPSKKIVVKSGYMPGPGEEFKDFTMFIYK